MHDGPVGLYGVINAHPAKSVPSWKTPPEGALHPSGGTEVVTCSVKAARLLCGAWLRLGGACAIMWDANRERPAAWPVG